MHDFEKSGSSQPLSLEHENVHFARAMAIPLINVMLQERTNSVGRDGRAVSTTEESRRRRRKERRKGQRLPTAGLRDLCPVARFVERKGTMLGHVRILLQKNFVMKVDVRGA
jgi:hypothetical protein